MPDPHNRRPTRPSRWRRHLAALGWCVWGLLAAGEPAKAQAPDRAAAETPCPPQARELSPTEAAQGLQGAVDRGLLWRASRNGRVVWLYGTLHAGQPQWLFPGPSVMAALRGSRRLAVELDLQDPDTLQRLHAAIRQPVNAPPVPPLLQQRLTRLAAAACLGNALDTLRPEMQALTLVALAGRRDGLDPAYGIDPMLAGLARRLNIPVVALETPELQIGLLTRATPAERDQVVQETLDELESGRARRQLQRLARAWADGQLEELSRYGEWCECLDTPQQQAFHEQLIQGRNRSMLPHVLALHQAEPEVFIAVGALHMVGPTGLPALLAAQGFELTRRGAGVAPR